MKKNLEKLLFSTLLLFTACSFATADNIVSKEYYPTDNINELSIDLVYENIEIKGIHGDEFLVEIESNNSKRIPKVSVENSKLVIETQKRTSVFGNKCTVYLYIPNEFYSSNSNIKSTSGDVTIEDFETGSISMNTTSGDIEITSLDVQEDINIVSTSGDIDFLYGNAKVFSAKLTSGDIELKDFTAEEITCEITSGDIETEKLECDYFSFKTTSGDIDCYNTVCQYFDIRSTSGSVNIKLDNQLEADSSIITNSGAVKVTVPEEMEFQIKASSSSGKLEDNFNDNTYHPKHDFVSKYNGGGVEIQVETTSGNIELDSN